MSEDKPTDEELRAAAALAEALEARDPKSGSADDALAAAQLLRYARSGGALDADQAARGREALEAELARRRRVRWSGFAAAAAVVAIAGFAALGVQRAPSERPPEPGERAVLLAQAHALNAHDPAQLASAMQRYREVWLDGLQRHYGGAP